MRDRLVARIRKAWDDPDGAFVRRLGRITSVRRLSTELREVERRRRLRGEDLDPEVALNQELKPLQAELERLTRA